MSTTIVKRLCWWLLDERSNEKIAIGVRWCGYIHCTHILKMLRSDVTLTARHCSLLLAATDRSALMWFDLYDKCFLYYTLWIFLRLYKRNCRHAAQGLHDISRVIRLHADENVICIYKLAESVICVSLNYTIDLFTYHSVSLHERQQTLQHNLNVKIQPIYW